MRYVVVVAGVLAVAACGTSSPPVDAGDDAGTDAATGDAGDDACALACGDSDGDRIPDSVEVGDDPTHPVDTDHDGTPDVHDLDSDDDTISDRDEWNAAMPDLDGDGDDDFRDLDSDGDGIADANEAGDADLATPPVECDQEIYAPTRARTYVGADGASHPYPGDGYADWLDTDSDEDGLDDGDEARLGTNRCALDSDGDGADDLLEGRYDQLHCTSDPSACGVASDAARRPPEWVSLDVLVYADAARTGRFDVPVPSGLGASVDVTTTVRALPGAVDGTRFVQAVVPACDPSAPSPVTPCWVEPSGVPHDAAVASLDATTFHGVVPGTTLTFAYALRDDWLPTCFPEYAVVNVDVLAGGHVVATREHDVVAVSAHCGGF